MSLRRRDVEQWMSHRRLPEELRRFAILVICLHSWHFRVNVAYRCYPSHLKRNTVIELFEVFSLLS